MELWVPLHQTGERALSQAENFPPRLRMLSLRPFWGSKNWVPEQRPRRFPQLEEYVPRREAICKFWPNMKFKLTIFRGHQSDFN